MPATPVWLASAEALLNRCIDGSAQAAAMARQLQGTSLQLDVHGIARVRAGVHRDRLVLLAGDDSPADAAISGSPAALLQLFKGGRTARVRGKSAVEIRGDAEIAGRYRQLFELARPDPEEELSRWMGDLPARRLALFARRAWEFAGRTRRTVGENIAEYLEEEGRDLVNKTELEEFLRSVDELRETFDRAEARLGRLEARLKDSA